MFDVVNVDGQAGSASERRFGKMSGYPGVGCLGESWERVGDVKVVPVSEVMDELNSGDAWVNFVLSLS